jgi:hypothetical protein
MSSKPEFDWVKSRADCTLMEVFNQLCETIEGDVKTINSLRKLSEADDSFWRADMSEDGAAIVVAQPKRIPRAKTVMAFAQNRIDVRQDWNGGEEWSATVGLNDQGRCILRLKDGTELEQWQFRKRALEGLFF